MRANMNGVLCNLLVDNVLQIAEYPPRNWARPNWGIFPTHVGNTPHPPCGAMGRLSPGQTIANEIAVDAQQTGRGGDVLVSLVHGKTN